MPRELVKTLSDGLIEVRGKHYMEVPKRTIPIEEGNVFKLHARGLPDDDIDPVAQAVIHRVIDGYAYGMVFFSRTSKGVVGTDSARWNVYTGECNKPLYNLPDNPHETTKRIKVPEVPSMKEEDTPC